MKTLIAKELRENFKWGALGLVLLTSLLLFLCHSYSDVLKSFPMGPGWEDNDKLQPLISSQFLTQASWLFAILALLLGCFQIHNETHHDLWAFLVHRPITRTRIFLGKILAGLVLYLLAAGVPLLCFIVWVAIPGHVAAPFEWSMALPVLGYFL